MRSQICCVTVTLALFFLSSSAMADDVVVLTEENFDKEVGQDRAALVEFYAPWYENRNYIYIHVDIVD